MKFFVDLAETSDGASPRISTIAFSSRSSADGKMDIVSLGGFFSAQGRVCRYLAVRRYSKRRVSDGVMGETHQSLERYEAL